MIDLAGASYAGQATTFAYVTELLGMFDVSDFLHLLPPDGRTRYVQTMTKSEELCSRQ